MAIKKLVMTITYYGTVTGMFQIRKTKTFMAITNLMIIAQIDEKPKSNPFIAIRR